MVELFPALDGPIPALPDLPALPTGYIYRTFRLIAPLSTYPRAFVKEDPASEVVP